MAVNAWYTQQPGPRHAMGDARGVLRLPASQDCQDAEEAGFDVDYNTNTDEEEDESSGEVCGERGS